MSKFTDFIKNYASGGFSPYALISSIFGQKPFGSSGALKSLWNKKTGAGLTGAELEANAFSAEQAQKQMDFQQQMRDTQYQSAVNDMRSAGLNPALMYGSGASGNAAPSGAAASSTAPSADGGLLDLILDMKRLGIEQKSANADIELKKANAQAAIMNAWSNFRNAGSQERQAKVAETKVGIEKMLADKHVEVDDATINKFAEDASYVAELRSFVAKNYEILEKNANSLERNSIAAMRQADASVQNAATNSYTADYSTDLMYSQALLNEVMRGEHKEILNKLPEKLRYEVQNLQKQGIMMDKQGRLIDKQGNLATAMQVKAYVSCATDVAKTVVSFIPGASSAPAPSANIDLTGFGAYGSY